MNLKLITTENFGELSCNFYRNMNDDVLLTREQIGQALEYTDPINAIRKLHLKHKDRLDELCIRIKGKTLDQSQNGASRGQNNNLMTERVYYTERGIMEICRWSRQPKANLFMDWVWDIVEQYRNNELVSQHELLNAVVNLNNTVSVLQKELSSLKEELKPKKLSKKKKSSYWTYKMFPKYQLLMEYFNISRTELYRNLFEELKMLYPEIDLNQLISDYCYENNLDSCYTLDAIEHHIPTRNKFEKLVNNLLLKYNLIQEETSITPNTIFHKER